MENRKKKKTEEVIISFSDEEVKNQVQIVMGLGRRTLEDSFKLGEMLVSKKAEKEYGEWLPYLEEIGLQHHTAKRLMLAFNKKDTLLEGMTYSKLVGISNSAKSTISKEKKLDWFDAHTDSDVEAYTLRNFINLQKKIEKMFGIVYLNEFTETINDILSLGITHVNYRELWKQE